MRNESDNLAKFSYARVEVEVEVVSKSPTKEFSTHWGEGQRRPVKE